MFRQVFIVCSRVFVYVEGNSSVFFTCVCMGFVRVCSVLCVCVVDFLVVVCMGFMNVHLFMCVWDFSVNA